jgi:hypothetical protein
MWFELLRKKHHYKKTSNKEINKFTIRVKHRLKVFENKIDGEITCRKRFMVCTYHVMFVEIKIVFMKRLRAD